MDTTAAAYTHAHMDTTSVCIVCIILLLFVHQQYTIILYCTCYYNVSDMRAARIAFSTVNVFNNVIFLNFIF